MEVLQQTNKNPDHDTGNHDSVVSAPQSDTMYEPVRYRQQARRSIESSMARRHDDRSIDPVTMAAASALVRAQQHARLTVAASDGTSAVPTAKEQWQRKFGNPRASFTSRKPNVQRQGVHRETLETQSEVPWAPPITSMYKRSEPQVSSPLITHVTVKESNSQESTYRGSTPGGRPLPLLRVEPVSFKSSPVYVNPRINPRVNEQPRPGGNSMSSLSRSSARSMDLQKKLDSSSVGSTSSGSLIASSSATGTDVDCSASSSGINEADEHGVPNESFTDDSSPTTSVQSGLSCPSIVASTSSSSSSPASVVVVAKEASTESKHSSGDSSDIETRSSSGTTATVAENTEFSSNSLVDETVAEASLDISGEVVAADDSGTVKTKDVDSIARDTIQAYIDLHMIADSADTATPGEHLAVVVRPMLDCQNASGLDLLGGSSILSGGNLRGSGDDIQSRGSSVTTATVAENTGFSSNSLVDETFAETSLEISGEVVAADDSGTVKTEDVDSIARDTIQAYIDSHVIADSADMATPGDHLAAVVRQTLDRQNASGLDLLGGSSISSGGNLRGSGGESTGPLCPVDKILCKHTEDDFADPNVERSATPTGSSAPCLSGHGLKIAARPTSAERGVDPPSSSLSFERCTSQSNPPLSTKSTGAVSELLNDASYLMWHEALAKLSNREGCDPPAGCRDDPRQVPKESVALESLSRSTCQVNDSIVHSSNLDEQLVIGAVDARSENSTRDNLSSRQTLGDPDVYATVNNTIECVSVDGGSLDLDCTIGRIYGILVGTREHAETEFVSFDFLVRLYFPALVKGPTSSEVSMMLNHAKELNVPLAVMDRLVDSSQAIRRDVMAQGGNERTGSFTMEHEKLQCFVRCLLRHFESSTAHSIYHDRKHASDYVNLASRSDDTFEVEVNDGYARQEFAPKPDEEPWWKVAARLDNSLDHGDTEGLNEIDNRGDSSIERPLSLKYDISASVSISLEDNIANHWKQREVSRQQEALTTKSKGDNARDVILTKTTLPTKSGLATKMTRLARTQRRRDVLKSWQSRQNLVAASPLLKSINAVDAVSGLSRRKRFASQSVTSTHIWTLNYNERTSSHGGFIGVDTYSLVSTSSVEAMPRSWDESPWESRAVKQRFLYEQSVTGRNWFGCLTSTRGNRKIKEPVCRPRSMEMPMEVEEWTEEWYKQSQRIPLSSGIDEVYDELSDDESWEKTPECGTIRNVRLKIGERISRVTPDLTSSLRRSRWRKKHFSPGTFPYN